MESKKNAGLVGDVIKHSTIKDIHRASRRFLSPKIINDMQKRRVEDQSLQGRYLPEQPGSKLMINNTSVSEEDECLRRSLLPETLTREKVIKESRKMHFIKKKNYALAKRSLFQIDTRDILQAEGLEMRDKYNKSVNAA